MERCVVASLSLTVLSLPYHETLWIEKIRTHFPFRRVVSCDVVGGFDCFKETWSYEAGDDYAAYNYTYSASELTAIQAACPKACVICTLTPTPAPTGAPTSFDPNACGVADDDEAEDTEVTCDDGCDEYDPVEGLCDDSCNGDCDDSCDETCNDSCDSLCDDRDRYGCDGRYAEMTCRVRMWSRNNFE